MTTRDNVNRLSNEITIMLFEAELNPDTPRRDLEIARKLVSAHRSGICTIVRVSREGTSESKTGRAGMDAPVLSREAACSR